jgi:four helix bundle protein
LRLKSRDERARDDCADKTVRAADNEACRSFAKDRSRAGYRKPVDASGTSVAANYRAACRSRSKAEFIAKLGTVEEEADESAFGPELIIEGDLVAAAQIQPLLSEAIELVAMTAASKKTASSALAKSQVASRKSQIS